MKKVLFSLLLSSSMLSACTMSPLYMRPEAPVAPTWQAEQAAVPTTVADIAWQNFFKSPELQSIIQLALDNNRDLRIAALNIEAARAAYRIQRADLIPDATLSASGTRQRQTEAQSTTGTASTTNSYEANLAVTAYEFDFFGRVRSLNKAALEDWLATTEARNAAQISLIAETANAYLQWLADQDILKLTEETLDAQQKAYDLIEERQKNGLASLLDVVQVKQAAETARINKALFSRRVEQDKNALVLLLGTPEAVQKLEKTATLSEATFLQDLPLDIPSSVLLARPDVMQAEHKLKSLNANIGAARAAFFPSITLTGTLGFASNDLSDLFSANASGAWSFMPQVSLPLFQGGRNFANLRFSKVRKEIAVAEYEKSIQVAFKEVADELAAKKTLNDQLEAQQALVAASQAAYDLSYARYKQGVDSFLNVLDAQRSLFVAQQNAIDLEKQRLANLVNLYKVLGGGTLSSR